MPEPVLCRAQEAHKSTVEQRPGRGRSRSAHPSEPGWGRLFTKVLLLQGALALEPDGPRGAGARGVGLVSGRVKEAWSAEGRSGPLPVTEAALRGGVPGGAFPPDRSPQSSPARGPQPTACPVRRSLPACRSSRWPRTVTSRSTTCPTASSPPQAT